MKIDSHQHFWNYDPAKYSWINDSMYKIRKDFLPSNLEPVLQKAGIDGTIAVEAFHSEKETEFLLAQAAEFQYIKGVVGWVDLYSGEVAQRLKHYSEDPLFKGVRHTVYDQKGEYLTDASFQYGIGELQKCGLTYDILIFEQQLPGAIELVKTFPEQPFVLDHMAKPQISPEGPSREWIKNIQELGRFENVYCKLSGLVTETPEFQWEPSDFSPFLEVVYNSFGQDRLMYGSDWPVSLSAASYEDTLNVIYGFFASSGEVTTNKIFGGNAVKFYSL